MDFNATIDLIIKDLDNAREIIDDLKNYQGVPAMQVELAKLKCKGASELIAMLKAMNVHEASIVKEVPPEPQHKSEPTPEPQPQVKPTPQTKLVDSFIIADDFSDISSQFNKETGRLVNEDLGGYFNKTRQVLNLSDIIGVNDRFLFIREIFKDNKEAYLQGINRLDDAESLTDAKAIVMSYTGDNIKNEAVIQLLELVKLKLSSNE